MPENSITITSEKGLITIPEGIMMIFIASIFDFIGFILFLFSFLGVDDYGILDAIAGIVMTSWLLTSHRPLVSKRFALTFIIELIPFLGNFVPAWTIMVVRTLLATKRYTINYK